MLKKQTYLEEHNTTICHIEYNANRDWEQWVLMTSDRHWDNPKSDRKLQKKHLNEALERNALIIDCGDLFCAMQGKYDPRSSKEDIRPEHQTRSYLDSLVETATEWFKPYAKNFILIGQGNHETAILKRQETDLTGRLCSALGVQKGMYSGFIKFNFDTPLGGCRHSYALFYHHGYGGDSPVTKGTIQTARMGIMYPDADIIITGHTHNSWVFPISRYRMKGSGATYIDQQFHVKLPTYKEEFNSGKGGWHIERGAGPKPVGAYWLRFYYTHEKRIQFSIYQADV